MKSLLWCAIGLLFGLALAVSAQNRIVDMPKQDPQQGACRCGPDCACCDDFEDLKKKR